ncbi:signal peptidase I [Campylobacter sp. VBCF_06 NA8]|uniref:signal peptidase I n=1 Tax=unclassified Campylobacter TaxID=2593542 RepID=UPI0022E99D74|nr:MULTISPECIES: signal peptidase I [unclassified Campylobacter]MDA3046533.1 signal peptidase I [Campylobacter sp. VBCF_06 NA8]MDA3057662.1 signal peptidase I [Campylobacter sp. VBCF_04 NA7]MDA3058563.1 signal peptidase I [Campylobacter sp. VBCF_05 NA6]MDA3071104.1 signal peptidase I [Campylobacter sp. VBCF_03 NA9]
MKFLGSLYRFSSSWVGTICIVLFIILFVAQAFVIPSGSMRVTLLEGDFLFVKKFSYGIPTPHIPFIEVPVAPDSDGDGHLIQGKRPQRGDIVVFRYPKDEKIHYVKRNFAVGGDEVIFDLDNFYLRPNEGDEFIEQNYDKSDIVILNGQKYVKEPYKFKGINYNPHFRNAMRASMLGNLERKSLAMRPIMVAESEKVYEYGGVKFNAFYIKVPQDEFFMIGDNRNNSGDSRYWGTVPYRLIVGKPWFTYFSIDPDKKIRWERIGRFIDTLQSDESLIYEQK